jgi:valyl-tRNA synthetase
VLHAIGTYSFTMEDDLSLKRLLMCLSIYITKVKLYRGVRMVNWDPAGMTAVSDEEVIHKETNAKLYYVEYQIFKLRI